MNIFRFVLVLVLAFPSAASSAVLRDGSLIPVRLTENVNGNINQVGQTVYFQVIEDVYAQEELVVRSGTFVKGKVKDAAGRKSMGRGGKLTLSPKSLTSENGQIIRFIEEDLGAVGRKRTGATVAHVIVWGPLGLFAKGRAAFIFLDTEYDLEVRGDVELTPLGTIKKLDSQLQANGQSYSVQFASYRKKINYRKGNIQKDFVLYVSDREQSVKNLNRKSIKITHVLGYELPRTLEPLSVRYDARKSRLEVTFGFTDIIKYIIPGSSEVTIQITGLHSENYGATITTEWKLK